MKNCFKLLFLSVIILMGMSMVASATPMCVSQSVVDGLVCSLGDLTFDFENVSFTTSNPSGVAGDALALDTPPTGVQPGFVTLGFTLLAAYPVDITLDYSVVSTSTDITAIASTFGPPDTGEIFESACSSNPTIIPPGCGVAITSVDNTTGAYTQSASFSPLSSVFIDKDVTDPGFSSFTDSIVETSAVPEPSSFWFLGAGLLGLAVFGRKLRFQ
jgi:hypothetical protein